MPTSQKVQIDTYDFGASLTAPTLAALATGTTITDGTASTCNEQTADAGVYIADFVGADASHLIPAGTYRLRTTVNGKPLKRFVTFTGVDGELVYARAERAVELDSALSEKIAQLSFDEEVGTLDVNVKHYRGTLQSNGNLPAKLDAIRQDTNVTLPGLINAIEGGGGSGTGARTVTITVNDGTTVLQNATVRMSEGANTFTALTNVSGVAVFNLDDATYTVGVTKAGYSYSGTTLVVDGTETATYSMTEVSITPPSNPSLSAIVVLCLDAAGQPEADVEVDIRIVTVPSGSQNTAYKGAKQTATSDVDGIARFEVVQGSTCEWKRGRADVWTSVAVDSDSVTNVTSVIGSP